MRLLDISYSNEKPQLLITLMNIYCPFHLSSLSLSLSFSFSQFHQHFKSSFCTDILVPKSYKAQLWVEKSCAKQFCTKRAARKCWWNLPSISLFPLVFHLPPINKRRGMPRLAAHQSITTFGGKKHEFFCQKNQFKKCLFHWRKKPS